MLAVACFEVFVISPSGCHLILAMIRYQKGWDVGEALVSEKVGFYSPKLAIKRQVLSWVFQGVCASDFKCA